MKWVGFIIGVICLGLSVFIAFKNISIFNITIALPIAVIGTFIIFGATSEVKINDH